MAPAEARLIEEITVYSITSALKLYDPTRPLMARSRSGTSVRPEMRYAMGRRIRAKTQTVQVMSNGSASLGSLLAVTNYLGVPQRVSTLVVLMPGH